MKLRNKKTGEIEAVRHNVALLHFSSGKTSSYHSLAELNEAWEDYKPKESKRYRLVKDLPTFKAGEIFEIFDGNLYKINESDGDDTEYEVMAYHASTLKRFPNILEDWFEPIDVDDTNVLNMPLIKDEKIRKAVRAWWETIPDAVSDKRILYKNNHDFEVGIYSIYCGAIYPETLEKCRLYTIDELCGEEE